MLRRPYFWLAFILLAGLGVAAFRVVGAARESRTSLALYLMEQVETAPDDRVAEILSQQPALGEPGLKSLVLGLAHTRAPVATTARATLEHELARWRELPAAESSPHVGCLARLLAAAMDSFTPAARRAAADLAEQLLEWPLDSATVNGTQLVADCEAILRAATENVRVERDPAPQPRREPRISSPEQAAALPGGGIAADPAQAYVPPVPRAERSPLLPVPKTEQPAWEKELAPPEAPAPRPGEPERFEPPIAPRLPRPANLLPDRALELPGGANRAASITPDTSSLPLSLLADFTVMQALHSEHASRARLAQAELARRGYSERQIDLARRCTDADPALRREFCISLGTASSEALPWLWQLAKDSDAQVRLAAVSLLVTSRDEEVKERLRQIQPTETNVQVQAAFQHAR